MKRRLLSALVALVCLGVLAPAVSAGEEGWCQSDPAIAVRTPAGNTVVVHLTLMAQGTEHAAALRDAVESYTVEAVSNQPATDVEIRVLVADDEYGSGFSTISTASTQPFGGGTVLDSETGKSGQLVRLRFRVDVP